VLFFMATQQPNHSPSMADCLAAAVAGNMAARGRLFGHYRPYLKLLAERQLAGRLSQRVDASDIVQQTFLEARRDLNQFHGASADDFLAWLTRLLHNNVSQTIRDNVFAAKRSVRREQPQPGGNESTAVWQEPAAAISSPSQRAMRGEAAVELARLLETLPADQREAVRLRHLEGWSLAAIATHMDRSIVATAGLIKRGLQALRRDLKS
jgi:RNA polymerase sigma-70 factor (ECF subfamily)